MKEFYSRKDDKGNFQFLKEHLNNVSELAGSFARFPNIAKLCGLLHDIGKFTNQFQNYLCKGDKKRGEVIHSWQGVYILDNLPFESKMYVALTKEIMKLVISSHHNKFYDIVSPDGEIVFFEKFTEKAEIDCNCEEALSNCKKYLIDFENNINSLFRLSIEEIIVFLNDIRQNYKNKASANFACGMLAKYIYSCLIDADRLDAYLFDIKEKYQCNIADWNTLIEIFEYNISKFPIDNEISNIRSRISLKCKNAFEKEPGIYQLSVPTGGGKTLSSLRFALHHAKKYNKKRIIYVIPYLSIIEQTAKNIREILNLNDNNHIILEHHSNVAEAKDDDEKNYIKLASSRWDSPIIITTMVQFLETVMSSKGSRLRKLHNMQDAVIIFDEIQSLPINSIYLFNEVISFLTKILDSTILLCTATQPLIGKTERNNLLLAPNPNLIDNVSHYFEKLKRTNIVFETEKDIDNFAQFIADKITVNQNCLVIVNTKKMARELYSKLNLREKNYQIFHLSTSMCAVHRFDKLEEIKKLLNKKEKIICISTQLIEAGVDISFDCVIRAMAGMDSILQAAGRCNRNGEHKEPKNIYVIPLKDENIDMLTDIKIGKEITARVIRENIKNDYSEQAVLNKYYDYFFFHRKNIMDYPTEKDTSIYDMLSLNNVGVNNFRNRTGEFFPYVLTQAFNSALENYVTIENNTETVVVYYQESEKLIEEYKNSISSKDKITNIRKLEKYSVSLYRGYEFDNLINKQAINIIDDEYGIKVLDKNYYSMQTGVVTNIEDKNLIL